MTIRALHHREDPQTSRQAIFDFTVSGARGRHMRIVLTLVRDYPGHTAAELMDLCDLDEYQIRRRLTDLKNKGFIARGSSRVCRRKKTKMVTWSIQ